MARKRNAAWTFVAVATVAVVLSAMWRTSDLGRAAADLDRQRAAAKREGLPTEYADLRRLTPPVPTDDNAALLYAQAFVDFRAAKGFGKLNPDGLLKAIDAGAAKPEDVVALRKALLAVAPALERAKAGSRRMSFSFDRAWEKGSALLLPEYAEAKSVGRALVLRAMLAADPARAADDLRAAARMRAHFGSEPLLIASLVGNAMEADVQRGIRVVGRRGGAWTRAMAPVPADLGPIPALHRSLGGEAAMGMNFDKELVRWGASSFGSSDGTASVPLAWRALSIPAVRDASMARVYAYWRRAWAELPEDPTDFRAAREALFVPTGQGPSYVMLETLLPVFEGFAEVNARSEANRRLSRAALALWSGRAPTLERDPFGTGPLRLKRDGKAWTLYSLGPDGKDDGGQPKEGSGAKGYDLVVKSR